MKSSKAEVIARCVWIGGIVVFIASLAGLPFYSGLIGVMISELCMGTALLGIGLVVLGASANMKARRTRLAPSPEAQHEMLRNISGIPNMSLCDTSKAILILYFVLDYKKHLKLFGSSFLRTPGFFTSALMCAVMIVLMAYFGLHIHNPAVLLVAAAATFVALVVLPFILATETLKESYTNEIPNRTIALIVNPTGVHQIAGKELTSVAWADVKKCRQIPGAVLMERKGIGYLVPLDAFHHLEDRVAFIDTLNAMKDGKPAPAYDWSAYAQVDLVPEDVWPPAIS